MTTLKVALCAGAAALLIGAPAWAQTPAPESGASKLEVIVVTARKRSEDALKIPVAVSSLSSEALEKRNIVTMVDVAANTPGMTSNNSSVGSARTDRSFAQIIIRGMTPSATTQPTSSIFINGVPVPDAAMLQNLGQVDHVEVLKGPQSAYFGRQTFAGAINVVSATPSNHWTAKFDGTLGTRHTYGLNAYVSGPIIADMLTGSIGARYDAHDGSYKNAYNPSETLGDQSTRSFTASLLFTPTPDLTIKAFGMIQHSDDGPAATGVVLASGPKSQSNCVVNNVNYFCGTIPKLNYAVTPAQNTTITPKLAAFLAGVNGIVNNKDVKQGFGLVRDSSHLDLNVAYAIPNTGLTITNLLGYNYDQFSELSDLSVLDSRPDGNGPGYAGNGYGGGFDYVVQHYEHNISEELRLATDPTKPLRGLIGFSYIDQKVNQAIGGVPGLSPTPSGSKTSGVFFSVAYEPSFLPKTTINLEGRYQSDRETAYNAKNQVIASGTSKNFLPRVSIQYNFTPDVMAYVTYSKGANPGVFNTAYGNFPAASKAKIAADGYSVGIATQPELITNYEIGFKARFWDGRASVSAAAYYDKWTDQLNSVSYTFGQFDPANPQNIPGSTVYNPNSAPFPTTFTSNAASSTPKGIEFEGNLIPIDHVTLNLSAAYNDTRYDNFVCGGCTPYPPSYNAKGKHLPFAPLFSTTMGAQYDNTINAFAQPMDWFARVDFIYRDGVYLQSSNTVKTPNSKVVNIRGGIKVTDGFSIEGYVNNLTNDKSPIGGFSGLYFPTFTYTAFDLNLPQLITGGVTVRYKY